MEKRFFAVGMLGAVLLLGFASYSIAGAIQETDDALSPTEERYIVTFRDAADRDHADRTIRAHHARTLKSLHDGRTHVVTLEKARRRELESDPQVLRVETDARVTALAKASGSGSQPAQTLPWGIDRIDAELVWQGGAHPTTANNVRVAVVDTGIALSHPDLSANVKGGYNAINPTRSANDDNGHGSHVAGTIGALRNTIGVVGVAPDVDLLAVKALNRNGSGWTSDIIESIDWAVANNADIINMSLGMSTDIQALHDAVIRAHDAGVILVAAAGNDYGGPVNYPAAYPEVIAVSATNPTDTVASFSSVGPEVDLAAPGSSIPSTYKGTGYATFSGTSMASPHVAGAAALLLSVPSACDTNFDGSCSPDEVLVRLESTAVDRGTTGFDNNYGYGVVNVWNALGQ